MNSIKAPSTRKKPAANADATPDASADAPRSRSLDLGRRVRALRIAGGMTLRNLSERARLSVSALSKIENGQLSPTYESLVGLSEGLRVDIATLFSSAQQSALGARSISRREDRVRYSTPTYDYELLCTDLLRKKMVPLVARIKAREIREFGQLISHAGEEVLYVLSGRILLHTECYQPTVLEVGDCAYFDSRMGHACTLEGVDDATVFWVCSSSQSVEVMEERQGAIT